MATSRRDVWRAAPFVVITCLLLGCGRTPDEKAAAFRREGDRYLAAGESAAASITYRNALKHQPVNPATHYQLASAYERLGKSEDAMQAFIRVTELTYDYRDANIRVARFFLSRGSLADAERLAKRLLEQNDRHVEALAVLATAAQLSGRPKAAGSYVARALSAEPGGRVALLAQASLESAAGRFAEARDVLLRAAILHPSSGDVWTALGLVEWRTQRLVEAEKAFERAVAVVPADLDMRRRLAAFFLQTGQADRAQPHLVRLAVGSVPDQLSLADLYLREGRSNEATGILDQPIRDDRYRAAARLRRAVSAEASGRRAVAFAELADAMSDSQIAPIASLMRSELLLRDGQATESLSEARAVAAAYPEAFLPLYVLGAIEWQVGNSAQAEVAFQQARKYATDPAAIDLQLAQIALFRGETSRALDLASAAARTSSSPAVAAVLARATRMQGDFAGARRILRTGLEQSPASPILGVELANLELAAGRPQRARAALESVDRRASSVPADRATSDPLRATWSVASSGSGPEQQSTSVVVARARLAWAEGANASALEMLEAQSRRSPADVAVLQSLAEAYLSVGDRAEARRYFERLAAARPYSPEVLTTLGMLREESGDLTAARHAYQQAYSSDSRAAVAANNLAWILAQEKKVEEALQAAQNAARVLPHAPPVLDTLAWMYHLAGRHEQAAPLLEKAIGLAPGKAVYRYHLGAIYAASRRTQDARAQLEAALRMSPDFTQAPQTRTLLASLQ